MQVLADLAGEDVAQMARAGAVPRQQRLAQQQAQQAAEEEDADNLQARLDAVRG